MLLELNREVVGYGGAAVGEDVEHYFVFATGLGKEVVFEGGVGYDCVDCKGKTRDLTVIQRCRSARTCYTYHFLVASRNILPV